MDNQTQQVMFSSKSDEWATPQKLFDKLNSSYNFTLDPCATAETAKCTKFYTQQDDGLSKSWANESVFINPPYSNVAGWVEKAYKENAENGATCVLLIPARTDTKWFHRYCMQADAIQFIKSRVKFENGSSKPNSAPFPSMIVVFDGKNNNTFPQVTGFIV
jgi:site-specific DNA-methyltransferase (adenine-specific)